MIFYFSATGNSKYVATRIAKAINENLISIVDCVENSFYCFNVKPKEKIGIICPTYYLGLPTIVCDFLKDITLINGYNHYFYLVATYGYTTGHNGEMINNLIKNKGYHLNAQFSVKMPDTWTPKYDLSCTKKIKKINTKAEIQIDNIVDMIQTEKTGNFMKNQIPKFISSFYYKKYEDMRTTNRFNVQASCNSCGLCKQKCPSHAIEIQNNKPVWVKEKCILCLGCLHRCPKFAIQYGNNTQKHGQYLNPNVKI